MDLINLLQSKHKKTIKIEGMHCEHCAKKVENTLKKIKEIEKVKVNLSKNEAIIISKTEIDNKTIQDSFKELDFKIINVK